LGQRIVALHGGQIQVRSRVGQRMVVTVRLPLVSAGGGISELIHGVSGLIPA